MKILTMVANGLFVIGAVLCGPFSLMFAHGGGVHWDELSWFSKCITGIAWVVLGIPCLIGFPLMWPADKLYRQKRGY